MNPGPSRLAATLAAYPTLLRVGFAEAIAYRAETIIWMLTNTMPLVNLALWSAVARGGAIGGYGARELTAYFLGTLVVRQLTSSWVLWEMQQDVRMGKLSMRLLRPIHPLIAYSAENLSALPLRAGLAVPVVGVVLAFAGTEKLAHDWRLWALVPVTLLGAWLINFFANALMGTLAFFIEQSYSVFQLWLGAYFALSGYLFPLDFLAQRAPWAPSLLRHLPFYAMAGLPVELMLGQRTVDEALVLLARQWAWVAGMGLGALWAWRTGIARYNAYGA